MEDEPLNEIAVQPHVDYVFYETATGRIVQTGKVERLYVELQAMNAPPGCALMIAKAENVRDYIVRDGAVVANLIVPRLEDERIAADLDVRDQAEARRRLFITPGIGKSMAYQQKAAEADAFLLDDSPSADRYPHIYGEAEAIGITPGDMAQLIIRLRDQWQHASAAIERIERAGILAVQAATTFDELRAVTAIDWSSVEAIAQSELPA